MYGSDALVPIVVVTTSRGQTKTPEVMLNADGGSLGTGSGAADIAGTVKRLDAISCPWRGSSPAPDARS